MRTEPPEAPLDGAPPDDDEQRLVTLARGGSREAAGRLIEIHTRPLFAACVRMTGDRDAAADLVQESFRKAWQALPAFRGESRFGTWIFRIAFTTHLKQVRRPRLVVPADPELEDVRPDPAPGPEADAARAERDRRLRRAVARLPEPLRWPIVAHYWADAPVREIAAQEGITPVAVRKRMAKAFRALAAALQETSR